MYNITGAESFKLAAITHRDMEIILNDCHRQPQFIVSASGTAYMVTPSTTNSRYNIIRIGASTLRPWSGCKERTGVMSDFVRKGTYYHIDGELSITLDYPTELMKFTD